VPIVIRDVRAPSAESHASEDGRVAVGVAPRRELIADENRIEADFFGDAAESEQVARGKLLSRGLVTQLDRSAHFPANRSCCGTATALCSELLRLGKIWK
jgi:hypothetical protein